MKKTFKLEFELEIEGELFALSSSAKAYKLAFLISRSLKLDLRKGEDLKLNLGEKKIQSHLNYICKTGYHVFRLIENKGINLESGEAFGNLFRELRDFDFIFYMESQSGLDYSEIQDKIRKLPEVNLALKFDANKLKNKEILVADL